jgi:hypothetical protein
MSFDMVTLRIGESDVAVDIPVYRDVLSAESHYFRGAFDGSFKEATKRFIPLTDVTEHTFRIFLQWAHMQVGQQPIETAFPGPRVLVPNCSTETVTDPMTTTTDTDVADNSGGGTGDGDSDSSTVGEPDTGDKSSFSPALDEGMYHPIVLDNEQTDTLYYKNKEWLTNFRSTVTSYLRLYIFADKYNVHQLRDDILTAFISQAQAWNWWPGTGGLIQLKSSSSSLIPTCPIHQSS